MLDEQFGQDKVSLYLKYCEEFGLPGEVEFDENQTEAQQENREKHQQREEEEEEEVEEEDETQTKVSDANKGTAPRPWRLEGQAWFEQGMMLGDLPKGCCVSLAFLMWMLRFSTHSFNDPDLSKFISFDWKYTKLRNMKDGWQKRRPPESQIQILGKKLF